MKRLLAILLLTPWLLAGCEQDDEILPDQQKRIVSFLTSSHSPRLVSEAELEENSQLPFYTVAGDAVYRYIESYYNPDRVNWPVVTEESKVTITFRAYLFANYSTITEKTIPFFTNDPLLEKAFYDIGLTPGEWSFTPLAVDMASTDIIKGLYLALVGCRQGDQVEAYMTYNMAYGDKNFSIIPRESPVAIFFTVNSVE
ncbi:FKBP-type peptidyl-prolyl cis-trans isomerase [Alistipes sp.]|uniref:FKBP-type peptidyl-prolyl cis-trans isomerase n=1 Tax=Alistipes sp. TaxID=1872444 RepID=UPI003AF132ED